MLRKGPTRGTGGLVCRGGLGWVLHVAGAGGVPRVITHPGTGVGLWRLNGGYLSPSLSRTLRAAAASCQGNMERQQVTTLSEDGLDSGFVPAVCGQDSCFGASRSQDSWAVLSWAALGTLSCWRETLPVVRQTRALTCKSIIHFHFLGHAIPVASNVEGEVLPPVKGM